MAHLVDVRVGGHDCFDRVAFELGGTGLPGYAVSYQPGPITEDASGEPVAVAGSAFLVVRMEPASGFDVDAGTPTYAGPERIAGPGGGPVAEVVRSGDFEAVLTWVIGVEGERPFTVNELGDPSRLVIDVG